MFVQHIVRRDFASLSAWGGIVAACGLIISAGFAAVFMTRTIESSWRGVMADNVASLRATAEFQLGLFAQKGLCATYLLDSQEQWLKEIEANRQETQHQLSESVRDASFTAEERLVFRELENRYRAYDALRSQVTQLAGRGARAEATELYFREMPPLLETLHRSCDEMLALNDRLIEQADLRSARLLSWLEFSLWGGLGGALLLGIGGGWFLWRGAAQRLANQEKFAALGELAASLAHEIRNPLTAIGLRLSSIRQASALAPSVEEDFDVIHGEVQRLERTVQDSLAVLRASGPQLGSVDVQDATTRAVEVLRPVLQRQRIAVEIALPESLPCVLADSDQFRQVLLNLLLNAIHSMPHGGSITIDASEVNGTRRAPRKLEVRVSDTGNGLTPRNRQRVNGNPASVNGSGTGLGLFIVRRILDEHGGDLRSMSREGPGSTFAFSLPVAGEDA